ARVLDPLEPVAGHRQEGDVRRRDDAAGALQHRRRDIERQHSVEALRKRSGHPPRPASDLHTEPASRAGLEPPEEPRQLGRAGRRVADVHRALGAGERIPRTAHLQVRKRVARASADPVEELSHKRFNPGLRDWVATATRNDTALFVRRTAHYSRPMVVADVRPRGPYSLELSARLAGDATRTFRDGILDAELPAGRAVAWQRPDGTLHLRATGEEAFEQMRFCLGVDDDHTPFVLRFQRDPFIGRTVRMLRGLRPLRTGTVAHALLRALCGQLILASEARAMERLIVRATTERRTDWRHAPPTAADLARLSPA